MSNTCPPYIPINTRPRMTQKYAFITTINTPTTVYRTLTWVSECLLQVLHLRLRLRTVTEDRGPQPKIGTTNKCLRRWFLPDPCKNSIFRRESKKYRILSFMHIYITFSYNFLICVHRDYPFRGRWKLHSKVRSWYYDTKLVQRILCEKNILWCVDINDNVSYFNSFCNFCFLFRI